MLVRKKTAETEALILKLLREESEVSVNSIAQALGWSRDNETERKAIGRALNSLKERNKIVTRGSRRSRVYVLSPALTGQPAEQGGPTAYSAEKDGAFEGIVFSAESKKLLRYISQDLKARTPAGYDQDFLRSYEPNKTFYLTADQRKELSATGSVEAVARPAGTYARNILNRLLIDLSWNSSRLEGNTYSLLETKRLLELGETVTGKNASEAQMILNHKEAIEYIVNLAEAGAEKITSYDVRSIHALLSENLLGDPEAEGRLRTRAVYIERSAYIPIDNPHFLQECFDLFIEKLNAITDPFEQSLFSLIHLSYLQAFEDVNKRTSRLVANISLVKENLRPLSFTDVDESDYVSALLGVYEKTDISLFRDLYIWAYTRSSQKYTAVQQSMGEPNLLKLKYRAWIHKIVRSIILDQISGEAIVQWIQNMIDTSDIPIDDRTALLNLIETEIISLHEGNAARFKVRPSEFQAWKEMQ